MNYKQKYLDILHDLRLHRRYGWPEDGLTDQLEDIYLFLTDEEREEIESFSWLAWPDLYDQKCREMREGNK